MINTVVHWAGRMPVHLILLLSIIALFPIVASRSGPVNKEPSNSFIMESQLSSLDKAVTWFNSKPLTAAALNGKVVLVEFGTYTCINWLRTLPYVRVWSEKYKDQGLVVIEVHTPEFSFERNTDNVRRAVSDMKLGIPVVMDNDYTIWNAFSNQYWPAIYLVDAKGRTSHQQFGEGGYEETEKMIQRLLKKAGAKDTGDDPAVVNGNGIEAAADWSNLKSQENYLGYERTENFSSIGGKVYDKPHTFTAVSTIRLNQWALAGNWTMEKQSVILNNPNGKITYRFHARDLHMVMGPIAQGTKIRFRVLVDGKAPGANHGAAIDEQGYGVVSEQRLYQLIRQTVSITDRVFEIEFLDAGAEAFSFTFG